MVGVEGVVPGVIRLVEALVGPGRRVAHHAHQSPEERRRPLQRKRRLSDLHRVTMETTRIAWTLGKADVAPPHGAEFVVAMDKPHNKPTGLGWKFPFSSASLLLLCQEVFSQGH